MLPIKKAKSMDPALTHYRNHIFSYGEYKEPKRKGHILGFVTLRFGGPGFETHHRHIYIRCRIYYHTGIVFLPRSGLCRCVFSRARSGFVLV